jgi:hypothetical protein
MVRKLPSERVTRFTDSSAEKLRDGLACKAARFALDSFEALARADPHLPEALRNRKADNWRVAVANAAGGDWPGIVRDLALGVVRGGAADQTIPTKLLSRPARHVRCLAGGTGTFLAKPMTPPSPTLSAASVPGHKSECDRAWSRNAVVYLNSLTDRPWAGWNHGKGISTAQLAAKISDYDSSVPMM